MHPPDSIDPPDAASAIVATGLTRSFGSIRALAGLSVNIPAGRIVGLVGRNGSGKSTFLRLCAGLLPPTSGTLQVLGYMPWGAGTEQRQAVAMVVQDQRLPAQQSLRNLAEIVAICYPTWSAARFAAICARSQLDPQRPVGGFSGGQQRLAACALTLATQARLLLLDEPAAGLDPLARRDLVQVLLETVDDGATTVIYSTHLLVDLEQGASHLLCFDGRPELVAVAAFQENVRRVQVILADGMAWDAVPLPPLHGMNVLGPVASGVLIGSESVLAPMQAMPGIRVIFTPVSLEEAYILSRRQTEETQHANRG